MTKLVTLAKLVATTALIAGFATSTRAGDEVDAATFFGDCPIVFVIDDTEVTGPAVVSGGCTVTVDFDTELTLDDVAVTLRGPELVFRGDDQSLIQIEKSSIQTIGGNISFQELAINDEVMIVIEDSTLVTGARITFGTVDVDVKNSTWRADDQIRSDAGRMRIKDSTWTTGDIVIGGEDIRVRNSTWVARDDRLLVSTTNVDVDDSTWISPRPISVTGTGDKDVKGSTLISGGRIALEGPGNLDVAESTVVAGDEIDIIATGVSRNTTVEKSDFASGDDLSISATGKTKAKDNDFTGVAGTVFISGDADCESEDNDPDIPCS